MKKLLFIFSLISFLFLLHIQTPTAGAATGLDAIFGAVTPPSEIKNLTDKGGDVGITTFLSTIVEVIFIIAAVLFVFMLLFSAVQWIISGGNKEAVAAARGRLTWAIVGIAILALAFVILKVVGQITSFKFFSLGVRTAFAATFDTQFGQISPPPQINSLVTTNGDVGISNVLTLLVELIYIVAAATFVFMLLFSAVQWIISGGNKEAVAAARGRLTWAIVGIAILALAFVILKVVGQITSFTFFS